MYYFRSLAWVFPALLLAPLAMGAAAPSRFTMAQVLHGFLRHASWLRIDEAIANFLAGSLGTLEQE